MSLIQQALEKAKQPDKTPLALKAAAKANPGTLTPALPPKPEHEPRLSSIKFYETLQKKVEEDIKTVAPGSSPKARGEGVTHNAAMAWIGILLGTSLLIGWFLFPQFQKQPMPASSAKPVAPASERAVVKWDSIIGRQKATSQIRFLLTGITAYADANYALINNQVVGVGDRLRENAVVKSISSNVVILDMNGRDITLTL